MNILNKDVTDLLNKNSQRVKSEILKLLRTEPSKADKIGWVYGFYAPIDKKTQCFNNFWIKIGRTDRNPFTRVNEWGGEMIFCFRSSNNHRLERLLHLFFNFARKPRHGIMNDKKNFKRMTCANQQIMNYQPMVHKNCQIEKSKSQNCFVKCLKRFFCCMRNKKNINTPELHTVQCSQTILHNAIQIPQTHVIIQSAEIPKDEENKTQNKEIEWFHFEEYMNVLSLTAQIWQLVEENYKSELFVVKN